MSFRTLLFAMLPIVVLACSGTEEPSTAASGGSGAADASTAGAAGATAGAGQGGALPGGAGGAGGVAGAAGSAASAGEGGQGGSTGGAAGTAGSAAGGVAGSAGGVAGSAGVSAVAECEKDGDCALLDDCCSCMPLAPGEKAPDCGTDECFVSACGSKGVSAVTCAAGQCVLVTDCDDSKVLCESLPPSCPEGEVPTVGGACWSGQCIKASYCPLVSSCDACDKADACVVHVTQMGQQTHCVEVPDVCKGHVGCACLGAAVCTPPWDFCSETSTQLDCGCPSC